MRKICVVITARASYSRIKTVLTAIQAHPRLDLQIVVTGSALVDRFGNIIPYLEAEALPVSAIIPNLLDVESDTASAKTTGLAVIELATFFANHRPDVVVTVADRFETIATAIAAVNMNIPLAHIQGGEMTGNIDDRIRNSISQLADLHFVATENARARLIHMGLSPQKVFYTGCPSIDLLHRYKDRDFDPYEIYGGVGSEPDLDQPYLVVLQHPVTTETGHSKWQIGNTLHAIAALNIPSVWFWPNADPGTAGTAQGIRAFREQHPELPFHFFKNMESAHFIRLLKNCACFVGNSSVGIRECSALGVPAVNIGSRQRGRERGPNVMDCIPDTEAIISAVRHQLTHGPYPPVTLYGKGHAGERIAEQLANIPFILKKHLLPA
ncbi:UDP-N-acetylglucosamine 2-epimerase/UDP-N-acetyl-D-glucosamine 2-epimerase, UDP-hydrolysing,TIGR03568 [Dyadobacter sp. SG02]|uniref:UDP-N-acetylglucosamine 2-epimerase n=1 Tax=Dyadobacter sp. SG02 TaxID=1855291 RepID=UPI0008CB7565|nr:UDP-N-acetylglucosamine 2-epimerase [Dyadobacter sp. SG02]SEJ43831.1 UDP-N-acetylglucosamine 2-epimerase/UDP-N-acetyl-D-glucosamine 2-epimerase, UDP-hydrolysing,TIGR03568 [Dyadobacter sp. SG02]